MVVVRCKMEGGGEREGREGREDVMHALESSPRQQGAKPL